MSSCKADIMKSYRKYHCSWDHMNSHDTIFHGFKTGITIKVAIHVTASLRSIHDQSFFFQACTISLCHYKYKYPLREAVIPHKRLIATLWFLTTRRSYKVTKHSTITSPQPLSYIIPKTCDTIYKVLKRDYLKVSKMLF